MTTTALPLVKPTASQSVAGGVLISELIGVSTVYLGPLSYFFSIQERCPIVSRIGTTLGYLSVSIEPLVAPEWANGTREIEAFTPYEPPAIDQVEDQLEDFIDRTVLYRLTILHADELVARRKFPQVALRYGFFREPMQQTETVIIDPSAQRVDFNITTTHIADVTTAFVKYINGSSLVIEVYGSK
ncbi:hypothetical protein Poli38472_002742 [Pythium oligandrum]|uniref:Uncharacterized protein n=1 Tax=Pythium oligandrum TaxID=41045 RepID=A0A8K1CHR4_PYTOL|nr:hypothetical protein Poli38472_002742 [Pythium oligandrum]|eukprot:TMW63801.1 hypothetical protein Poli38472_002742 [Pythium oligandrum]